MIALRTTCPGCSAKLRIRSEQAVGRRIRCPRCMTDFVAAVAESSLDPKPTEMVQAGESAFESTAAPVITTDDSRSVTSRIRRRRVTKTPRVLVTLGVLVAVGVCWLLWARRTPDPAERLHVTPGTVSDSVAANVQEPADVPAELDPIPLDYIPVVPQLLLHIHPARLWSAAEPYRQFTGTLGNTGAWLKNFIEQSTRFDVSEIGALTISVNFGSRGSEPDIAMVVRTTNEHSESQLLQEHIKGTMVQDLTGEVIESGGFGWMIVDAHTIALATLDLAEDLANSRRYPVVPSAQMDSMLRMSSRTQLMTLFVDLQALDAHKDLIFVEQLHQIAESAMLWFLPDTGTVSWSMQLQPHLMMKMRLAPNARSTATGLQRRMQSQLSTLPDRLLALVGSLTPRSTGHSKLIGRFPAMMQALQMGTEVVVEDEMTVLKTVLPQKAAANLAAGATLTWNQTLPAASLTERLPVDASPGNRVLLAEQLERQVLVDFRRVPLHEAIEYLGQSLDVPLIIDGDALMLAGFTQNMPQTHSLGTVTVLHALNAILRQYEGMLVIAHDQAETSLLLTTDAAVGDRTILRTD